MPATNLGKYACATLGSINSYGKYGGAEIRGLRVGDVVEVTLSGSARETNSYYSITVAPESGAKSLIENYQIIQSQNVSHEWMCISTTGLFRIERDGNFTFSASLDQGHAADGATPGVNITNLGLIAKVVSVAKHDSD